MKEIKEHFSKLIDKIIPNNKHPFLHELPAFCYNLSLVINKQTTITTKNTKEIKIIISADELLKYSKSTKKYQDSFDTEFIKFINKNINDIHASPSLKFPPTEQWHFPK
jgi:hypothetical protein